MKHIDYYFSRAVSLLFLGLLTILCYCAGMTLNSHATQFYKLFDHPQIFVWMIAFVVMIGSITWYRLTNHSVRSKYLTTILLVALLFTLQMIVLFALHPVQITDAYIIRDQAAAIANGTDQQINYNTQTHYFIDYGNNYFFLTLCVVFYKLLNLLSISDDILAFGILNVLFIDVSIWFGYRFINCCRKDLTSMYLLLCVLNPLNYLFIHWSYTCTWSLPFMTGILYLYARSRHTHQPVYQWLCRLAIGICSIIGFYLRPTILIPTIALLLIQSIRGLVQRKRHAQPSQHPLYCKVIAGICLCALLVLCFCGIRYTAHYYAPERSRQLSCHPLAHDGIVSRWNLSARRRTVHAKFPDKVPKSARQSWQDQRTVNRLWNFRTCQTQPAQTCCDMGRWFGRIICAPAKMI